MKQWCPGILEYAKTFDARNAVTFSQVRIISIIDPEKKGVKQ